MLSAHSFVLDTVEGQPECHSLRSCFVGMTTERLQLLGEQFSAKDTTPGAFGAWTPTPRRVKGLTLGGDRLDFVSAPDPQPPAGMGSAPIPSSGRAHG